jgi:hypothetical protein
MAFPGWPYVFGRNYRSFAVSEESFRNFPFLRTATLASYE